MRHLVRVALNHSVAIFHFIMVLSQPVLVQLFVSQLVQMKLVFDLDVRLLRCQWFLAVPVDAYNAKVRVIPAVRGSQSSVESVVDFVAAAGILQPDYKLDDYISTNYSK